MVKPLCNILFENMNISEYINKIKDMGHHLTYTVTTFGCQMNAKDSEKLEGLLDAMGFTDVKDEDKADIVIFNTCTVRENANDRLYGHIGQLKNSYLKNKHKIIGICGCMMQEKDEVDNILKKFPYVKIIFGTYNLSELPMLIYGVLLEEKKQVSVYDKPQGIVENLPTINKYDFKCGINISYGCNNYCTYCIVPYVRGPERSREKDDIIREIKEQINKGVKEVMLLGQNVNSYGNDNKACSFPELLSEVAHIDGLKRVRFMTSNPKDLSRELVKIIKENDNICRHIHLPVQSGSDRILSLMNRKYTRDHYIEVVDYIKSEIPDISLTTDVIVGFPTETEDDFRDTISLLEHCQYDSVFTFIYSKRNGTKAATMDGQVDIDVINKRFKVLLDVVKKMSYDRCESMIGKTYDAMVENIEGDMIETRLSNNLLVHLKRENDNLGDIINVKLIKNHNFYFDGERV